MVAAISIGSASNSKPLSLCTDNQRGSAEVLLFLASIDSESGRPGSAIDRYREVLDRLRDLGDPAGTWLVLLLLAEAQTATDDLTTALETLDQAALAYDAIGPNATFATFDAYGRQHYCPHAEQWSTFSSTPAPIRGLALRTLGALTDRQMGIVQEMLHLNEQALLSFERALERSQPLALWDRPIHLAIGRLLTKLAQSDRAGHHFRRVIDLARRTENWRDEADTLAAIAAIFIGTGRSGDAIPWLESRLALARRQSAEGLEADSLLQLGKALRADQKPAEARVAFKTALAVAQEIGDDNQAQVARDLLALNDPAASTDTQR